MKKQVMKRRTTVLTVAVFMAGLASVMAQVIPIPNGSFENPVMGSPGDVTLINTAGTYSWIAENNGFPSADIEYAGAGADMSTAVDGNNFAFLDGRGGFNYIYQDGITTIDATKTYTLTFWVGQLIGTTVPTSYEIDISKNDATAASYVSSAAPGPNNWTEVTLNYTPLPGDNGQSLGLFVSSSGSLSNSYIGFDDFQLVATPEPSGVALMMAGFAALWLCRRKKIAG